MIKYGFVFSGGLAKGSYQMGFINALKEYISNEEIKAISSSSIGAINAYFLAADKIELGNNLWKNFHAGNIFSLFKELVFKRFVKKNVYKIITSGDEIKYPFYLSATSVIPYPGLRYYKIYGKYKDYWNNLFLSSIGFPVITGLPRFFDKRMYIDGGLIDNIPVLPLLNLDLDVIIVVHFDSKFRIPKFWEDYNKVILEIDLSISNKFYRESFDFKNKSINQMFRCGYEYGLRLFERLFKNGKNLDSIKEEASLIMKEEYVLRHQKFTIDRIATIVNRIVKKTMKDSNKRVIDLELERKKKMIVLGIESSCDETSVAILKNGKKVLSNIILSQIDIHKEFGGVIPEIASRNHVLNIINVLDLALKESGIKLSDIDAIGVTKGPGLVGSLLVGINLAESISFVLGKPLYGVNHLVAHLYAGFLKEEFEFPLLGLLVSGGHTELVLMKGHFDFEVIGSTLDDAVGEAYDKVGRVLGLDYPSGPIIDKYSLLGEDNYDLPDIKLKDTFNFSFSGIKSAVVNKVHNIKQRNEEVNVYDMCKSFQERVVDVLVDKTIKASNLYNVKKIIVAGGVAANKGLRKRLVEESKVKVIFPDFIDCTDNALMVAKTCYHMILEGFKEDKYIDGNPGLDITDI